MLTFPSGSSAVEERVTVSQLGRTANRVSAHVVTECLTCDPNTEPAIESEVATFLTALPLNGTVFNDTSWAITPQATSAGGGAATVTLAADGTGTWVNSSGTQTLVWGVDPETSVLVLRGTGTPGAASLLYHQFFLTGATTTETTWAGLYARVPDTDQNGTADLAELSASGTLEAVTLATITLP